ncbi:MAG: hypothetical protein ABW148_17700 [Sedimenticola sp.]
MMKILIVVKGDSIVDQLAGPVMAATCQLIMGLIEKYLLIRWVCFIDNAFKDCQPNLMRWVIAGAVIIKDTSSQYI